MFACLDIRACKDLIAYKTYADLRAEAERTYLGVVWWILEPLISMFIYYLVFGVLLKRGTEDFIPFLVIGVIAWQWFSDTVQKGSVAILTNVTLVRQVAVQKIVFPIITILTNTFKFAVSLGVLFVFVWAFGFGIQIHYLAFPVILLMELLVITAVTLPLCAIVPFFPDFSNLISHALRVLFFMSGIFFPITTLSPAIQKILFLNPMALLIHSLREVLMYNRWPPWQMLLVFTGISLIGIYVGAFLISRFDQIYAKRITQ